MEINFWELKMTLHVYNHLTSQLEVFETIEHKTVKMYVCGPTVYDQAHVGHAMSAIVFDVIRRYLEYLGYRVIHAMNFTDVDDKIIQRAAELGVDPLDLAQGYIEEWFDHSRVMNILPAHHYPRVSQVIPQIIALVEGLIDKGYGYLVNGDVYYRVRKFPDYGKLSHRSPDEAIVGTRALKVEEKKDPLDFVLWKGAKPGEPAWDSPWGPGRPGWHIECSAMVLYFLGSQIDIHGGGNDLIFPHHENEIAQSEAYTEKHPFARYWLYNGMLQLRGEKMSKSLGNLVTIREFLSQHNSDALRLLVLSSNYRKPLGYNSTVIADAQRTLRHLQEGLRQPIGILAAGEPVETLRKQVIMAEQGFHNAMEDDFNTASALAHIHSLVRSINSARDAGVGGEPFASAQIVYRKLVGLLGLELREEGRTGDTASLIETLVEIRTTLRKEKQWALADIIRQKLELSGIILEDDQHGTRWYSSS